MAEVAKNIKLLYSHIHTLPHTHTHTHTYITNYTLSKKIKIEFIVLKWTF